jgi:cytochrome c
LYQFTFINLLLKSLVLINLVVHLNLCNSSSENSNSKLSSEQQVTAEQVERLFRINCASCHLDEGQGGSPNIESTPESEDHQKMEDFG